jgi:hypothetical protein
VLQTTAGKMIFGRYVEAGVGPQPVAPVGPQPVAERDSATRVRATPHS